MCGIIGFSLARNENIAVPYFTRQLLLGIESRGKDATGIAYVSADRDAWIVKADRPATRFNNWLNTENYADLNGARLLLGHTRWATQGDPSINDNNHPISTNGYVGIHNGHIGNDDDLFARPGMPPRIAQVDSEAAIALLSTGGEPTKLLGQLRGSAALAWIDTASPDYLHLARVTSSPLVLAQTKQGSLVFGSTRVAVLGALGAIGRKPVYLEDVAEGTYMRVRHGVIDTWRTFDVPRPALLGYSWGNTKHNYDRPSAFSSKVKK